MSRHSRADKNRYALENSIGYLLNRAAHLIAARFSDDLKPHDVSLQAWRILAALSELNHLSISELADHTGAELSYVSRSVAVLEERGLIERMQAASDKRRTEMSLTDAGVELVKELAPKARAVEKASEAAVSAADLKVTLQTLRAVCNNLVALGDAQPGVNRKLTIARRVKNRADITASEAPVAKRNRAG